MNNIKWIDDGDRYCSPFKSFFDYISAAFHYHQYRFIDWFNIVDTNILNVNSSDISDDYEQPSINENSMDLLILMVYK